MNKFFMYVMMMLCIVGIASAMNLSDGLIAYYSLDGYNGNETFTDYVNSFDGVLPSTSTFGTGHINTAYNNTNGMYGNISTLNFPQDLDANHSTINMWIYLRSYEPYDFTQQVVTSALLTRTNISSDTAWCSLGVCYDALCSGYQGYNWTEGKVAYTCYGGGSGRSVFANDTTLALDTWNMITLSSDGINTLKIYINGVSVQTEILNGDWAYPLFPEGTDYILGGFARASTPVGKDEAQAMIDEIGLWNKTLSDADILQLYNSGNGLAYPLELPIATDNISVYLEGIGDNYTFDLANITIVNVTAQSYGDNIDYTTICEYSQVDDMTLCYSFYATSITLNIDGVATFYQKPNNITFNASVNNTDNYRNYTYASWHMEIIDTSPYVPPTNATPTDINVAIEQTNNVLINVLVVILITAILSSIVVGYMLVHGEGTGIIVMIFGSVIVACAIIMLVVSLKLVGII